MKGVILAGGTGSRLMPLTKVTNKHLLPVYNKPMIYYPLFNLKKAGITEVMIISGRGHCGDFLELLESGSSMGMDFVYDIQEEAGGIAQALNLAKGFVDDEKFMVILGDNIIEDNLSEAVNDFNQADPGSAMVFLKEVKDPQAYGVAEVENGKILNIEEKPANPKSNLAVVGCYMYDKEVFNLIEGLKPSARNELEITDVNNLYVENKRLNYFMLEGFWGDGGESFESLYEASTLVKNSALADIDSSLSLTST